MPTSTAQQLRDANPYDFTTDTVPAHPEEFSQLYGVTSLGDIDDKVDRAADIIKPTPGDIEALRFYLGISEQALADEMGIQIGTLSDWKHTDQQPKLMTLASAVTVLTDAWNDKTYRDTLTKRTAGGGFKRDPNREFMKDLISDILHIPDSSRNSDVRGGESELGHIYGGLTGDYQTPVHATNSTQLVDAILTDCTPTVDRPSDYEYLRLEVLRPVVERVVHDGEPHPSIVTMDRGDE